MPNINLSRNFHNAQKLPIHPLPPHLHRPRTPKDVTLQRQHLPRTIRDTYSATSPASEIPDNANKNVNTQTDASTPNASKHQYQKTVLSCEDNRYAPHPFILQPPHTTKKEYTPDDTFNCNITLIGEAINLLPWIVLTFHEMGKRRIGLRGARGQCLLRKVETLHADSKTNYHKQFTPQTPRC